jgi:hypothetical protein
MTARARAGFVPAPASLCLALAAAACLLTACSPGAEYPSLFPGVHDAPPPRTEVPMDQVELQKATEDLITQRDHLNAEAPPPANQAASTAATPGAKKKAAADQARPRPAAAAPPATTASAQTAGADPKP